MKGNTLTIALLIAIIVAVAWNSGRLQKIFAASTGATK